MNEQLKDKPTEEAKWQVTVGPTDTENGSITDHWESDWMPWDEAQLEFLRCCTKYAGFSPGAFAKPVMMLTVKGEHYTVTIQIVKWGKEAK